MKFDTLYLLDGVVNAGNADGKDHEGEQGEKRLHGHDESPGVDCLEVERSGLGSFDGVINTADSDGKNNEGEQGEEGLHGHGDLQNLVDVDSAGNVAREEKGCYQQNEKRLVEHVGFLRG